MIGYHCVHEPELSSVLEHGLLRALTDSPGCPEKHICIAETPELAATMHRPEDVPVVLAVHLDGLEGLSEFVGLEARVHNDIAPQRITHYVGPMGTPTRAGWVDPGLTAEGQHPSCLARRLSAG